MPKKLPTMDYPFADEIRWVDRQGNIDWGKRSIHVTAALHTQLVGAWRIYKGRWEVWYGEILLGYIDSSRPRKKLIPPKGGLGLLGVNDVHRLNCQRCPCLHTIASASRRRRRSRQRSARRCFIPERP